MWGKVVRWLLNTQMRLIGDSKQCANGISTFRRHQQPPRPIRTKLMFLQPSDPLCFDCGCCLSFLEGEESSKHREHEDWPEPDSRKSKIWKVYTQTRETLRYFRVFWGCACVSASPVVSLHLLASRESDAGAHLLHFRCGAHHRCWPPHKDTSGSTSWNKCFKVPFRAGNTLCNYEMYVSETVDVNIMYSILPFAGKTGENIAERMINVKKEI